MKLLTALGLSAAACVHSGPSAHGPEGTARAYAQALEAGRLDAAWALSTPIDHERFLQRYADPAVRHRRAEALLTAAEGQPGVPLALEGSLAGWRVVEPPTPAGGADDVLQAQALIEHFLAAVQSGDFDAVYTDLSASWRARYTPARLKSDFSSEPSATARLERIRAALPGSWELTATGPELALGAGLRLRLRREGGALKVVALE